MLGAVDYLVFLNHNFMRPIQLIIYPIRKYFPRDKLPGRGGELKKSFCVDLFLLCWDLFVTHFRFYAL